jgi:hypothetical protein
MPAKSWFEFTATAQQNKLFGSTLLRPQNGPQPIVPGGPPTTRTDIVIVANALLSFNGPLTPCPMPMC